jgi:hypothetical protein
MSTNGTSRQFAAALQLGRLWREADIVLRSRAGLPPSVVAPAPAPGMQRHGNGGEATVTGASETPVSSPMSPQGGDGSRIDNLCF